MSKAGGFIDPDATPSPATSDDEFDETIRKLPAKRSRRATRVLDDEDDDDLDEDDDDGEEDERPSDGGEDEEGDDDLMPDGRQGRGSRKGKESQTGRAPIKSKTKGFSWEETYERSWDIVREQDGTLEGAVNDMLLGSSRTKRILKDTTSIQRGIIRHVYLVIDLSLAMLVKEFKATWLDLTIQYAQEFVTEFFDQNPISQMAILCTRSGTAERLSPLSGNPMDHLKALQNKKKLEARGEPSLMNVMEMARSGLSHLPPHGSREVIVIMGSLTTCDPGNIHDTITSTVKDKIRVNIIGLSAEMKICKDICTATKGIYGVAKDDLYLRELLFEFVSPPATLVPSRSTALGPAIAISAPSNTSTNTNSADLMLMGFPALVHSAYPGICSCHSKLKNVGFTCPRCRNRLCDVPTECRICGLTVVSSPHLARSYRHLFPVKNYEQVDFPSTSADRLLLPVACFSCSIAFPVLPTTRPAANPNGMAALNSLSLTSRYSCSTCKSQFCLDCDVLVHGALGFCPGCC